MAPKALALVALVVLLLPAPAQAGVSAQLVGAGTASQGIGVCTMHVAVSLQGVERDGGWLLLVEALPPWSPVFCNRFPYLFQGPWDPAAGGCLGGAMLVHGIPRQFCIDAVPGGEPTEVGWAICGASGPCSTLRYTGHQYLLGRALVARG